MIDHIVRGVLLLTFGAFGLPVLIAFALSLLSSGKTNFKVASHIVFTGLRALAYAIGDFADVAAEIVAKRYPEKAKWLQPVLKALFSSILIVGGLYLISVLD